MPYIPKAHQQDYATLPRSPRPSDDNPGLFLSLEEYKEVVERWDPAIRIDSELHKLIYGWTEGHVGAVVGILHTISIKARQFRYAFSLDCSNPVMDFVAPT